MEERLAANDYEGAADLLMAINGPSQFQRVFRALFDVPINLGQKSALCVLTQFRPGPIITTNFDRIIESVFEAAGCPFEVIAGEQPERTRDVFQHNADALLKVHGELADPSGRVLTKQEYDASYTRWLTQLLRNLASDACCSWAAASGRLGPC